MAMILFVIIGGLAGWLASTVIQPKARQRWLLTIAWALATSALAGYILSPLLRGLSNLPTNLSANAVVVCVLGTLIMLRVVKLFPNNAVR